MSISLSIFIASDLCFVDPVSDLFCNNADVSYISHSELMGERAVSQGEWSRTIAKTISDEVSKRIAKYGGAVSGRRTSMPVLVAKSGDTIVAAGMITVVPRKKKSYCGPIPYVLIEDLVVLKSMRGKGVGRNMMLFISKLASDVGCRRLFLESGVSNHGAHHFFEEFGFSQISHVYMTDL